MKINDDEFERGGGERAIEASHLLLALPKMLNHDGTLQKRNGHAGSGGVEAANAGRSVACASANVHLLN